MASSSVRRVLGDKDANTSLNVRSPRTTAKAQSTSGYSFLPAQPIVSPISKAILHSLSPQIGQKRKLEDSEEVDHSSQRSDNSSDRELDDSLQSSSMHHSNDTNNTSFTAGHGAENVLEPQFELPQEEMSQKTLDKLHDVPMPQDNYESPPRRPKLSHEVSLGSAGMSSFINFEDNTSSQGSDGTQTIEHNEEVVPEETETPKVYSASTSVKEDERKKMLEEKTSQLRTRLQLALFKIQTNQTSRPFKRLKPPASKRAGSSSPPVCGQRPLDARPSSQTRLPDLPASQRSANRMMPQVQSPESQISSFRARATAQVKPTIPNLASLPVPRIQPTAYSSRWMTVPASSAESQEAGIDEERRDEMDDVQLPSSPPLSRVPSVPEDHAHPGHVEEFAGVQKTPKTPAVTQSIADIQLSSPPASELGNDEDKFDETSIGSGQQGTKRRTEIKSLTSSVVKGEAADGLLQLMRGAEGLC